jgi:hypothetical protein
LRGLFATDFAGLLLILLLQTIVPVAAAQEREIAYDNGTPGGSVSLPSAPQRWSGGSDHSDDENPFVWIGNQILAVRFTQNRNTVQMLLGVRFYIAGDPESFNVWLFNSDKFFVSGPQWDAANTCGLPDFSYVPYKWTVTPTSTGWVYLNVTDSQYPVIVAGDFYVAIEFTIAQQPSLGVDTTGPRSNRGWFVANESDSGWIEYSTYAEHHGLPDGNLMIRSVTTSWPEVGTTKTAQTSTQTPTQTTTISTTIQTSAMPGWTLLISTAFTCLIVAIGLWHTRRH